MKKGIITILVSLISILIGLSNVNASTITSFDTWTNYQNGSSNCGTSGMYSYTTTLPNVQGQNFWESGKLNTRINGQAHDIALSFNTALLANTYYDVTINFMSNDLRYTVKRDNLVLYSGSSCQDFSTNNLALVSFTNNATSSKNTNQLKFRIYSSSVSSYWTIVLSATGNQYLTSVSNFGIKNIDVTLVQDNSTEDIINNQTNNTENIINNNNSNTEQIIENQNSLLGSKCENLLGITNLNEILWTSNGGATFKAAENLIITNSSSTNDYSGIFGNLLSYALVDNDKTYTISFDVVSTEPSILQFGADYVDITNYSINSNKQKITKTFSNIDYKSTYFVFYNLSRNSSTITITNIMVSEGTSAKPFCLFGTTNSKLDDINQTLTGEQNYNKDASEEIEGKEEINNYNQKEEELFSNLNFEGIGNNEITINPNTSSFIWQIVEKLRGMNGKIILLMTSILGLGIIKMILNR